MAFTLVSLLFQKVEYDKSSFSISQKILCFLSSGNHTPAGACPGSRSYSDLVDTPVCIHQLVLKDCLYKAAAYGSFQLMHSSSQDALRIGH